MWIHVHSVSLKMRSQREGESEYGVLLLLCPVWRRSTDPSHIVVREVIFLSVLIDSSVSRMGLSEMRKGSDAARDEDSRLAYYQLADDWIRKLLQEGDGPWNKANGVNGVNGLEHQDSALLNGVKHIEEFSPLPHPLEQTDIDQPVHCPAPEPCIVHVMIKNLKTSPLQ